MISVARFAGSLADKHGPRLFLIAGPAIAGAGMLILSFVQQTSGPSAYWTTFFPGILILGLGMSFTVAPLTTTVMGSVNARFSGTASGINNAMTRISSVFANAIFGALAVLFFSGTLSDQIKTLPLNHKDKEVIVAQAGNLGNAKVPRQVSNQYKIVIEKSYHMSFIKAYANIMRISAILGFLGALMAVVFIKNDAVKKDNHP
jgi:MFS family permease